MLRWVIEGFGVIFGMVPPSDTKSGRQRAAVVFGLLLGVFAIFLLAALA